MLPSRPAPATESWFEPLPAIDLNTPNTDQKVRAQQCIDRHRVHEPDVTAAEVLAAADCVREVPLPGHEIRLYKHLMTQFPSAPELKSASRSLGNRYEQIDARPQAVDAYLWFLRRWPAEPDAQSLGKRAACLAWSVGDKRLSQILGTLEKLYGRKGFERPTRDQLSSLCAAAVSAAT